MKTTETGYMAVVSELKTLNNKLPTLLPDPIQAQRKLFVESGINQLIGPLEHAATLDDVGSATAAFGPMTDLAAHGIVKETLDETAAIVIDEEEELKALQAKVDEMYPQLETLAPEVLLDYVTTPGGELVIRAILGRLKMEDYKTVPLNFKTIEEAVELKKAKDTQAAQETETNKKLDAQKAGKTAKAL